MTRNKELVRHVGRLSRSQVYAARGLYKGLKKSDKADIEIPPTFVEKPIGGDKNGEKRLVPTTKAPRFYPAEDVRQPKKSRKSPHAPSLRSSITPGTVLILLAGRYRGKRVIFLKSLASGLLLVTGPFKVNGVPLRRVNQAYVIATSTKVDVTGVQVCLLSCSPMLNLSKLHRLDWRQVGWCLFHKDCSQSRTLCWRGVLRRWSTQAQGSPSWIKSCWSKGNWQRSPLIHQENRQSLQISQGLLGSYERPIPSPVGILIVGFEEKVVGH